LEGNVAHPPNAAKANGTATLAERAQAERSEKTRGFIYCRSSLAPSVKAWRSCAKVQLHGQAKAEKKYPRSPIDPSFCSMKEAGLLPVDA
jgi:hypothetical protein